MRKASLRIFGLHHEGLRRHLFPGDHKEAVAFAMCGRHEEADHVILTVQRIETVPHKLCTRARDRITWPSSFLAQFLDEARRRHLGIVKFHSHPEGFDRFSELDDEADLSTFSPVFSWLGDGKPHGSAVIMEEGKVFGRLVEESGTVPFSTVTAVGDDIKVWHSAGAEEHNAGAFEAQAQIFGAGTVAMLRRLCVGVVGCSGTGSIVIELLTRLGVGSLVLVDHDDVQERNLNRILNSKRSDIGRPKVEVLAEAVSSIGFKTEVVPLKMNLFNSVAVRAIAACDVVFGCMDTAEGRHLLNRISTFYVIPYFDLGVHLRADGKGGVDEAGGVVHYLQPGRSSLLSRRAFTMERVTAENLYRTNPEAYKEQRRAGYIEGVDESSPAVASINATISSLAVNEFLSRILPFRSCWNSDCASVRFNFMETMTFREEESEPCVTLSPHVGRGTISPLLDMPALS